MLEAYIPEVILDLACGQGGGARGMTDAGHYVVGCDIDPGVREGYLRSGAHEFIEADALDLLRTPRFLSRFTFITAHPPCQGYSSMSHCRPEIAGRYPKLVRPIHALLERYWTGPWAIENVWGARDELPDPAVFCMFAFGRETYRHRVLWSGGGFTLAAPQPGPDFCPRVRRDRDCGWPHPVPAARAGHWEPPWPGRFVSAAGHERKEPMRRVMEIDWMTHRDAVKEAIPPYLGAEIVRQLTAWRVAQEAAA